MEEFITLDECVNMYMLQYKIPDGEHANLTQLGIRGYRNMHNNRVGLPVHVEIPVLANGTGILPCNYLSKIAVYVYNSDGQKSPLTEDENLGLGDSINRKSQPTSNFNYFDNNLLGDSDNINAGYPVGIVSHLGTGSRSDIGFYRIDRKNKIIIFDLSFGRRSVWLEFLPVASDDDGDYIIHPLFQEATIEWLGWQYSRGNPKSNPTERAQNKENYYNALRVATRGLNPFDSDQVYLQYRRTTRLTVRS